MMESRKMASLIRNLSGCPDERDIYTWISGMKVRIAELETQLKTDKGDPMSLGELMVHEGAGIVTGGETGRVVAKFSHEAEAEAFCLAANHMGEE